jgi:hypothetical protein
MMSEKLITVVGKLPQERTFVEFLRTGDSVLVVVSDQPVAEIPLAELVRAAKDLQKK